MVDAYLEIFQHSMNNKYGNILILEDDFFFNKEILKKGICNDINNFLLKNKNKEFLYYLGCIPLLQTKYHGSHNKMVVGFATHAVIYSKAIINKIFYKIDRKTIIDWDANSRNFTRYIYKTPLCYQLFPETENSKSWINTNSLKFDVYFIQYLIKKLHLDENVDGYSELYYWSFRIFQILFTFIILILLFCLYYIFNRR